MRAQAEKWQGVDVVAAILKQVCDLGYIVTFSALTGATELAAVPLKGGLTHSVTIDARGEDGLYKAACALAVAVGIELEDG